MTTGVLEDPVDVLILFRRDGQAFVGGQDLVHSFGSSVDYAFLALVYPFVVRTAIGHSGMRRGLGFKLGGDRREVDRLRNLSRAAPCFPHHSDVGAVVGSTTFERATGALGPTAEFRTRIRTLSQRYISALADSAAGLVALALEADATLSVLR